MVKGIVGGPNAIYGARVWTEKSHAFCAKNFSDITWHMTSLSKQKHRSRFHQGPIDISRHSIWTYDVITVNSVTMYGSKLSPGYFFHHIFLTPRVFNLFLRRGHFLLLFFLSVEIEKCLYEFYQAWVSRAWITRVSPEPSFYKCYFIAMTS